MRSGCMSLLIQQQRNILRKLGLEEYVISKDRYNYKFNGRVIAREFNFTGNGYVWGKELLGNGLTIDPRGWINVKNFSESELESIIQKAKNQTKFKIRQKLGLSNLLCKLF
jgi:hypothetical protein